jgi:hypothetical protein
MQVRIVTQKEIFVLDQLHVVQTAAGCASKFTQNFFFCDVNTTIFLFG